MTRAANQRRTIQRSTIALGSILALSILGVLYYGGRSTVRRYAAVLVDQASARLEAELAGFFGPVTRELFILHDGGLAGGLDLGDPDRLNGELGGFLRRHPWVVAAIVADDQGREHRLVREGLLWRARRTFGSAEQPAVWLEWLSDSSMATEREEVLDYDPRGLPWFVGAALGIGRDEAHWTAGFVAAGSTAPTMIASLAFQRGGRVTVVAFETALLELSRITETIAVGGGGVAYVLDEGHRFVGLPRGLVVPAGAADASVIAALLQRPDELGAALADDLAAAASVDAPAPVRFVSAGSVWWGRVRPFPLSPDRHLAMAVAVPESDLADEGASRPLALAALAVLMISMAIGCWRTVARAGG